MQYLLMGNFSLFLPFLPVLPTQILLNNFLYDLSQVTIPTDNVNSSFRRRWLIFTPASHRLL